jgi:Tfp pilus assembly protein FimT
MKERATFRGRRDEAGVGIVEVSIVLAIILIICAIALPNLLSSRRMIRSASMPREAMAQLRMARQLAMSQRVVYTWRYDDASKQISVINNGESLITYDLPTDAMVELPGNPAASANVVPDVTITMAPLTSLGLASSEITYGRPSGAPTGPLDDGTTMTALPASRQINIVFQPNGSVVDAQNNPVNRTFFIYNSQIPSTSAYAVSVLGTTGRIKLWRFDSVANKYVE